jgi:pyruvate/2-oxoglutarate/acetoin dehydrogenase E1 component
VAKALIEDHSDFLRESVAVVAREIMEAEIERQIGAGKGEVSEARTTHRNGYPARPDRCGGCDRAGGAARRGDHPLLMNAGGLRVVFPSTPNQAFWLTRAALRSDDPVVVLHHPALAAARGTVNTEPMRLGDVDVTSHGDAVSVFAIGMMARRARKAAAKLAKEGIGVEVIDVCSLALLPREAVVAAARRTGRVVVVDEARLSCSGASEIAATIAEHAFDSLRAPIVRLAVPDVPIPFAPNLEPYVIPDEARIDTAIRKVLQ